MDIKQIFPAFLLNDHNGYALARAIEAGLTYMNEVISRGLACISDCDTMPEWRLDEIAWETDCLYDYNADVEKKRKWIKDALPQYRLYGTPEGIYRYVRGYFDDIILEEWWEYGGEPYHFRITVDGNWTPEDEAWVRKAVGIVKNVRSVLDAFQIGIRANLGMTAEGEILLRLRYPMTGEEHRSGTYPENTQAVKVENADTALEAETTPFRTPYIPTGTHPENTQGVQVESVDAALTSEADPVKHSYNMTGEDKKAGTYPENTQGVEVEDADAALTGETEPVKHGYNMTSEEKKSGTYPEPTQAVALEDAQAGLETKAETYHAPYTMTGTVPETAKAVQVEDAGAVLTGEADGKKQKYRMAEKEQKQVLTADAENISPQERRRRDG